ncbi:MAG: heat-inducible transcriptional repressor HrcA [Chloroflexota bacterium]|nr:heat-inducible transcriptional repressor HrcA [Chloroflexota bacterium]
MLSARADTILKSIIAEYITKGTPVSSQTITNEYELGVSPATIRNEMMRLEQEGYIMRPYPSAGSVPSDKGYRHYVDSLTDVGLPQAEQVLIDHLFHQIEGELEQWLSLAAAVIAKSAQNIAVVTKPKPAGCQFKHVELVALQDALALLILVMHGARVKQQLVTFDRPVTQGELAAIANKLNDNYADLDRSQISTKDVILSTDEKLATNCLLKMMRAEDEQDNDEPYLDGWHFMLNQPEFANSRHRLALMELIEHRKLMRAIIPPGSTSCGVQVTIGRENKTEVIQEYTVVTSQYGLRDEAVGTIGVVGPTRMHYDRVISTVDYLSSVLSTLVAELYGRKPARPDRYARE